MKELKDYNFNKPGFDMKTGHFTQVVWKNTTKVGFGYGIAKEKYQGWDMIKTIVVANYGPPGNYMGDFPNNVFKAK